ncbi:endolytic transglycosylase MltG [Anaeromyxobacter paludicola]|uniref:Endolytic murein transglycosylase n=1 Tax=Anaeromyxobacter paludicola TaxID=2918171 RepID=A0ABM7X8G8_9BACT|nr:endolytic transglycosylase MltG [Anaeromyxobacter paludicola]BDG08126.1 aminodeoxychorismate lyase [Anaeromyxobacter paludicola]
MRPLRALLLAGLAGAALLAGWLLYERAALLSFAATPFGSAEEKLVDVPAGSSAHAVVRILARSGVLSDERIAWRYVRWLKRDKRALRAGEYAFAGPLTPDQVLERVYRGEVKTYKFTVPEGLRMDEIAAIVEDAGLGKARDLLATMRDPAVARELGVPFPNLEGYLFPDTYAFTRNPKPRAVVDAMVARFRAALREAEAQRLPGVRLSEKEAVTLASIVEKETGRPEERPHISCVFHNRLRRGMRLQTDPTVMYATMLRRGGRWSQNITRADLLAAHPYNTYTSDGLPPGPIASPGEAALVAALHPSACDDLYFVSRNDGTHVFCPDLACHNAAVRKWQVEFFRRRAAHRPAGGGAE